MNDKVIAENEFMKSNKYMWRPFKAFVSHINFSYVWEQGEPHLIQRVKFNVL